MITIDAGGGMQEPAAAEASELGQCETKSVKIDAEEEMSCQDACIAYSVEILCLQRF